MLIRSILLAAAGSVMWAGPAAAQSADAISLKIDFVSWSSDLQGLTIHNRGGEVPVTAMAFRYSDTVRYTGSDVLEISQGDPGTSEIAKKRREAKRDAAAAIGYELPESNWTPTPEPEDKLAKLELPKAIAARRELRPNLVGLVKLPRGSAHITVLLAPGPGGSLSTQVIDDDPTKLPPGRVRIHNFAAFPVALRLAGVQGPKVLEPMKSILVEPVNGSVIYELAYQADGEWVVQENNVVPVRPDEQVQMVVLKSEAKFFAGSSGDTSGYMQIALLRRQPQAPEKP